MHQDGKMNRELERWTGNIECLSDTFEASERENFIVHCSDT